MGDKVMYDLWKWLFNFSRRKFKEEHLKVHKNDIKCPNCNEWYSISGIDHQHTYADAGDWGAATLCGKCGHLSYWNLVAFPFPVLCDENGDV